jgi:hypothetical protein
LVGAFRLNDPIVPPCGFLWVYDSTMASAEQQRESLNIQLLVDSIPALIHTARPNGCIDYFNRPGLDYLGATLDDVNGDGEGKIPVSIDAGGAAILAARRHGPEVRSPALEAADRATCGISTGAIGGDRSAEFGRYTFY